MLNLRKYFMCCFKPKYQSRAKLKANPREPRSKLHDNAKPKANPRECRSKLHDNAEEQIREEMIKSAIKYCNDSMAQGKVIRAKSNVCNSVGSIDGSLNQPKLSLNRSSILPRIDNDYEEVNVNDEDLFEQCLDSSCEENSKDGYENKDWFSSLEGSETDLTTEQDTSHFEESETEDINLEKSESEESPYMGKSASVVNFSSAPTESNDVPKNGEKDLSEVAIKRKDELENICIDETSKIEQLNLPIEKCVRRELDYGWRKTSFDMMEKKAVLKEIQILRNKLQSSSNLSSERLRKSGVYSNSEEERQIWMDMERKWIFLIDKLRIDVEFNRRHAEKVEMKFEFVKKWAQELDDALVRENLGHARMVEQYAKLQQKYKDLAEKHWMIMEGIAEVKSAAAAKAGG